MENEIEFIEKITEKFRIFDKNFLNGYMSIINNFCNYLLSEGIINDPKDIMIYLYDLLLTEQSEDKNISINDTIEKVLAFFKTLGPRYEEMALNALRDTKIARGPSSDSSAYDVFVSGNDYDASTLVHEITHSFVVSKDLSTSSFDEQLPEDRFSPLLMILSEINSYVFEFLYYDYCETIGDDKQGKYDMIKALMILVPHLRINFKKIKTREEIYKIIIEGKAKDNIQKVLDGLNVSSSQQLNSQYVFLDQTFMYSHPFGIMVACYIYQKILEDPKNMIMCTALEKAQTVVGDEESMLRYLEELGIPCFKNGKISLDESCVLKLCESMERTLEKLISDNMKKTPQF